MFNGCSCQRINQCQPEKVRGKEIWEKNKHGGFKWGSFSETFVFISVSENMKTNYGDKWASLLTSLQYKYFKEGTSSVTGYETSLLSEREIGRAHV